MIARKFHWCGSTLVIKLCPTLATPWTVALQASLSKLFPRQEYRSELPFPSPGDLPNPGVKPMFSASLALQADFLLLTQQGNLKIPL